MQLSAFHMYMFMNHCRNCEQSNTDMMITGLEVIVNLCRQNASVQVFLKGMVCECTDYCTVYNYNIR